VGHSLLLASVIITNMMPALGQIGAYFFDALTQSQVWINVQPQNLEPGPPPVELNVTVSFPGRRLVGAPAAVDLRVSAYCLAFPTRIRQPLMTVIIDGTPLQVAAPGRPFQVVSVCGDGLHSAQSGGTADAIVARIPFATLRRIASAADVELHALGFDVRLRPSDLQALQSFVAAVADGVTVR
jgi:hypothetical protein